MSAAAASWVQVTAGGYRWQVRPEYRERLVGPQGLRLEEWLRGGQARVVKHGPHRTVYHVTLPGLTFYLKHFRVADVRARLREMVRPAKARMEYDRALAVAGRRVPTITPLGLGVRAVGIGPGDSFLATHTLEDVEPLSTFLETTLPGLPPVRRTRLRRRVAEELGALIARMHEAGILHHDLHAANLLITVRPDDSLRLFLIDLHAVHLGRPLGWRRSRANLVLLGRWFSLRASRADRLRFWRAYCRVRAGRGRDHSASLSPSLEDTFRRRARDLEARGWRSNLAFWRRRDRRCLERNRRYQPVRGHGVRGHAVRDLDPPTLAALLADPDEPFRRPGVRLLKDSPSTTVAELSLTVDGVPRRVVYKRFAVTSAADPWLALLRPTPALRSWVHGHGLRERCLPAARPLVVLHRYRYGLPREGYLLAEKIDDATDLHRILEQLRRLPPAERRAALYRLIERVARLVRDLHRRRLSHRDLKAANILVQTGEHQGQSGPHVWLIDLVGVTRHRRLRYARRIQNLARLHASFFRNPALTRTDKLRFLRVYLQWGLVGREGWKLWWKDIERATQAKEAHNRRRGRPLA